MFLIHIALRIALTVAATWLLGRFLPQYFFVSGGTWAFLWVGLILTILNLFMRTVLDIFLFPLRIISRILFLIFVNAGLLWLATVIVKALPEGTAVFEIRGGIPGWIIASIVFGLISWVIRDVMQEKD